MLQRLSERGFGGRAFWITGQSGTGKTTIARLIAAEVADPHCTIEIDASELTTERAREFSYSMRLYGLGKGGRAFIVNEAHGLRAQQIRQLEVILEPAGGMREHVVWIFTTTTEGEKNLFEGNENPSPLLSRCIEVRLSRQGLAKPMAEAVQAIARAEGLDGQDIARYVRLMADNANNMRRALQRVESGEMLG